MIGNHAIKCKLDAFGIKAGNKLVKVSFQLVSIVFVLTLVALIGCGGEDGREWVADANSDGTSNSNTGSDSDNVDNTEPAFTHALPQEHYNEMCVGCHTCGIEGTPIVDQQHDVCTSCHLPDGSVDMHGDTPCAWSINCDTNPPEVSCNECHTVQWVNDLCMECHEHVSLSLECFADNECLQGEVCFVGDCLEGCRPDYDRCPGGLYCDNGACQPAGTVCTDADECRINADCVGDASCVDCVCACTDESECRTNADCAGDAYCIDCACACTDASECSTDTDCVENSSCIDCACVSDCTAEDECRTDGDCFGNTSCVGCVCEYECRMDEDCEANASCDDYVCVSHCSADMRYVSEFYICIDVYEASRPDATDTSHGTQNGPAQSVAGVLPWRRVSLADAQDACNLAGKRLCSADEWVDVCQGSPETVYVYGDEYDPIICNGIDTFCNCESETCWDGSGPCPYPYCFRDNPDCRAGYGIVPTGQFESCVTYSGLYDMNGNVWEFDQNGLARGGAYNCLDSLSLHKCTAAVNFGTGERINVGFRCCKDPD